MVVLYAKGGGRSSGKGIGETAGSAENPSFCAECPCHPALATLPRIYSGEAVSKMKGSIREEQYRSLAALRYYVRAYLRNVEVAASNVGLEYQQYCALLAIRAISPEQKCTVRVLSDQLLLRHHSAVELVDRMEQKQLVRRTRDDDDHRQVCIELLPKGERLLATVVRRRLHEVYADGRSIVETMQRLLDEAGKRPRKKASGKPNRKRR